MCTKTYCAQQEMYLRWSVMSATKQCVKWIWMNKWEDAVNESMLYIAKMYLLNLQLIS
jgi:hypothetical protein